MKDTLWYLSNVLETYNDNKVITIKVLKEIVEEIEKSRFMDEKFENLMSSTDW